jgi:hypothetical protein
MFAREHLETISTEASGTGRQSRELTEVESSARLQHSNPMEGILDGWNLTPWDLRIGLNA